MTELFAALALVAGLLAVTVRAAPSAPEATLVRHEPSVGAELFKEGPPHQISIEIAPHELDSLRKEPREFIGAMVRDGGMTFSNVAVHLKGSVGSFRPVDDKPALTLDFSRFNSSQKFYGLRRIHLNNSVEDPSYCNEWLGSELSRKAGVPAPRVAHAVVTVNSRRLGLYVLKEGFTEDFLSCYFKTVGADLYEPGEGHDVNQRLKRNSVRAPHARHAGLETLAEAAREPDAARRWEKLQPALNTDEFIRFMALEIMLCHRDGYCLARNNFRVYRDADSGRFEFFPHGMDQLLGIADLPWDPHMAGLVARAVMETPQGRQLYRKCFTRLFTEVWPTVMFERQVDQLVARLQPALTDAEFAAVQAEASQVKARIAARQLSLQRQLAQPELNPLQFDGGMARLRDWLPADRPADGQMGRASSPDGKPALWIMTQGETAALWKTKAVLNRGRYRFEGRARTADVKPLPQGIHQGAGLRLEGEVRKSRDLTGDTSWELLGADFEVQEDGTRVQFICELRAKSGEVWFETDSLRVIRLP